MSIEFILQDGNATCIYQSETGMNFISEVAISDYPTEEDAKKAAEEKAKEYSFIYRA